MRDAFLIGESDWMLFDPSVVSLTLSPPSSALFLHFFSINLYSFLVRLPGNPLPIYLGIFLLAGQLFCRSLAFLIVSKYFCLSFDVSLAIDYDVLYYI
jgi:hypothetical protein